MNNSLSQSKLEDDTGEVFQQKVKIEKEIVFDQDDKMSEADEEAVGQNSLLDELEDIE